MSSDLTDSELITLYLDRNDNNALDTLVARHHHYCFEKFNSHYNDELFALDLCKQLWVSILVNQKNQHHEDIGSELKNAIDALLINPLAPVELAVNSAHEAYQNEAANRHDPLSAQTREHVKKQEGYRRGISVADLLSWKKSLLGLVILAGCAGVYYFSTSRPQLIEPNSIVNTYAAKQMNVNSDFLYENIITHIDWQYGFVIEEPSAHDAFVVGSYMVDLVNLDVINHSDRVRQIARQLQDIHLRMSNDDIQNALDYLKENPVSKQAVINLVSAFENFYSDHSEQNYFRFGKWIEYNFLFTKLAIELDDVQIYSNNLYTDNRFLEHFLSKGKHPQLVKQEIRDIEALSLDTNASIDKLKIQLRILGNLRSLLF